MAIYIIENRGPLFMSHYTEKHTYAVKKIVNAPLRFVYRKNKAELRTLKQIGAEVFEAGIYHYSGDFSGRSKPLRDLHASDYVRSR